MARAIVGGLLFSTFVSLVLLPTIYTWLDIIRHWPAVLGRRLLRVTRALFGGAGRLVPRFHRAR
jgi:HAE1 family hydrophobic/amphiphilic exporter-1